MARAHPHHGVHCRRRRHLRFRTGTCLHSHGHMRSMVSQPAMKTAPEPLCQVVVLTPASALCCCATGQREKPEYHVKVKYWPTFHYSSLEVGIPFVDLEKGL